MTTKVLNFIIMCNLNYDEEDSNIFIRNTDYLTDFRWTLDNNCPRDLFGILKLDFQNYDTSLLYITIEVWQDGKLKYRKHDIGITPGTFCCFNKQEVDPKIIAEIKITLSDRYSDLPEYNRYSLAKKHFIGNVSD